MAMLLITYLANLKKINIQQKGVLSIIFNKLKLEHTKYLFKSNKVLNVYQRNIWYNPLFIHKIESIESMNKIQRLKPTETETL